MKYSASAINYMKDNAKLLDNSTPEEFCKFLEEAKHHGTTIQELSDLLEIGLEIPVLEYLDDKHTPLWLFRYNEELTSITIPDSFTVIREAMFDNCRNLTNVHFPKHLEYIRDFAFSGTNLSTASLPNTVKKIGSFSFFKSNLESFTCPYELTDIDNEAFSDCSNLKSFTFNHKIKSLGSYVFSRSGLTEITIPGTVENIPIRCCYECNDLNKVTIESGVKGIGTKAFARCPKLTVIEIPQTITYIESNICGSQSRTGYSVGKVKYKIQGFNKEEGITWAKEHISFEDSEAKKDFIRKII